MDRLKFNRRPYRAQLTKLINEAKTELKNEVPDAVKLKAKSRFLNRSFNELKEWDNKVREQMMDDLVGEEDQDREFEDIGAYVTNFYEIEERIEQFCQVHRPVSPVDDETASRTSSSTRYTLNRKHVRLPKIELQKFSGELKDWLGFWSQFKKIHENPDIEGCDKLHYLQKSMLPGTTAHQLVASYPQTSENYPQVVEALVSRYGNEDMLLQVYLRELLKLVITNSRTKEKIPMESLVLQLDCHLRALDTLNLAKADPATWLFPLVESSLEMETLLAWQRSPLCEKDGSQENPPRTRLDILMEFLKKEVSIKTRIQLAQSGFEDTSADQTEDSEEESSDENVHGHQTSGMRPESVPVSKDADWAQPKSDSYAGRSVSQGDSSCSSTGGHQQVIDMQATVCSSAVKLMTLMVDVCIGKKKKAVRAFLDPGSQFSYILGSTAKQMGIVPVGEDTAVHALFGAVKTKPTAHKKFEVNLQRHGGGFSCKLGMRSSQRIGGLIPRYPKDPALFRQLKEKHVYITDVGDDVPKIEVLIGGDVYGRLMTGKMCQLDGGITALDTKLGWVLSGQSGDSKGGTTGMVTLNMAAADVPDVLSPRRFRLQRPHRWEGAKKRKQQERPSQPTKKSQHGGSVRIGESQVVPVKMATGEPHRNLINLGGRDR